MTISFLRVLGLDDTTPADAAAAIETAAERWPRDAIQPFIGEPVGDPDSYEQLIGYLQSALRFAALRPGASGGRVGLWAELHVVNPSPTTRVPLVATSMRAIGYYLEATDLEPAHVFVVADGDRLEVAITGLPVEIELPAGLLEPPHPADDSPPPNELRLTAAFAPAVADSVEVTVRTGQPSAIKVRVNARLTGDGDVLIEPVVPLSFGPVRISGVPARGVHDFQLFPTLVPRHVHAAAHLPAEQPLPHDALCSELPLDWTRHAVAPLAARNFAPSAIAARTIDVDPAWGVARWIVDRGLGSPDDDAPNLEIFFEDAMVGLGWPIPLHGRVGFRRRLNEGDIGGDAYNLDTTPVRLEIAGGELQIFRLLLQTTDLATELPFAADLAWVDGPTDPAHPNVLSQRGAFTVSSTETGDLIIGRAIADQNRPGLFSIAGFRVHLAGLKIGMAIKKALAGGVSGGDVGIFLVDLELRKVSGDDQAIVELRTKTGQPSGILIRDLGWNAGAPSTGALYDPSGADWLLGGRWKIAVREAGLVTTPRGKLAVMLSGSAGNMGASQAPTYNAEGKLSRGLSISVQRLKMSIDGLHSVTIDGLGVDAVLSTFWLHGFGMISRRELAGLELTEAGFDVQVGFTLGSVERRFGVLLWIGKARPLSGTGAGFEYALGALTLPQIPAGPVMFRNVRALGALNLAPNLPPPSGSPQPMRIYHWYKDGGDALSVPLDRQVARWRPENEAWALGLGTEVSLAASDKVRLSLFGLVMHQPSATAALIGAELFFEANTDPLAQVIVERDPDRGWSVLVALDLPLNKLWPSAPSFLANIGRLSGQFFHSQKPSITAFGFFDDPATWIGISTAFDCGRARFEARVAFCYHRVTEPSGGDPAIESISVKALSAAFRAVIDLGWIARLDAYITADITWGQWRTQALASGATFVVELGIRARLCRAITLGLMAHADIAVLGPSDNEYKRASVVLRFETPWWLPDVTVRWEKIWNTPQPEAMDLIAVPVVGAQAITPGAARTAIAIGTTPLAGITGPTATLAQLSQATAVEPSAAAWNALTPVSPDSIIALDFGASVDGLASLLPPTPAGAAQQRSGELAVRYELVEIGMQRRPIGATAWTDLVDPATTRVDDGQGGVLDAEYHSELRFEWDADATRVGRLDPRRLLVNADTPYSLTAQNPETDEDIATTQPHWPCCEPPPKPTSHVVHFADTPLGLRTPRWERFSASTGTLRWSRVPAPVVALAQFAPAGRQVARIDLMEQPPLIWRAAFRELASRSVVELYFRGDNASGELVLTGYRGLTVVVERVIKLNAGSTAPIVLADPGGIDSVTLRLRADRLTKPFTVELVAVSYDSRREQAAIAIAEQRCKATEDRLAGQGRLAFLPRHDYQLRARVRIILEHATAGTQSTEVEQRAYFRTSGLPGLGWVPRIGDQLEPYVASRYPASGGLVYRREPIALAFHDGFNVLVPVGHGPGNATPERQQLLEWTLAVEHAAVTDVDPVSETGEDWLSTHVAPGTPPNWPVIVMSDDVVRSVVRIAPAQTPIAPALALAAPISGLVPSSVLPFPVVGDPYRVRFDRMLTRADGCEHDPLPPPPSQVLLHAPRDPSAAVSDRWRADSDYQVSVRKKAGPYARRDRFSDGDLPAFTWRTIGGPAVPWRIADGALVSDGAARQLAVFGDAAWDHLSITAEIDPGAASDGEAGVAIGVGLAPLTAIVAVVGGAPRELRLLAISGSTVQSLATAPLPQVEVGGSTPDHVVTITLTQWDDRFTAAVGDVTVSAPRPLVGTHAGPGRTALVARNGGAVRTLRLRGIDAYRAVVHTSRYDTFAEHMASFTGPPAVLDEALLGPRAQTIAQLLTQTGAAITQVMTPGASAPLRDQLFRRWITALRLPLVASPERVLVSRYRTAQGTIIFLVESPEPIPLAGDVSLVLERRAGAPPSPFQVQRTRVLTSGDQRAVLIVPVNNLGVPVVVIGDVRIQLALERRRYPSTVSDDDAVYRDQATLLVE